MATKAHSSHHEIIGIHRIPVVICHKSKTIKRRLNYIYRGTGRVECSHGNQMHINNLLGQHFERTCNGTKECFHTKVI